LEDLGFVGRGTVKSASLRGMKKMFHCSPKHMAKAMTLACLALLCACGDGKKDAADQMAVQGDSTSTPTGAAIDLSRFELPLLLTPPDKQYLDGQEPQIVWKEEIGKLEITAGDHFGLQITEEPADIGRLKADLDRDLLRKSTIIKETPELVIYKSEFPDDSTLVFIHFYQIVKAGDRTFVVEDTDAGKRFNEQDVERMVAAVGPKQPV
jgi:hypothetical protein